MPHDYDHCLYLSSFVIFLYAATMMSRIVVSVDRFWAIYFPFSYHTRKNRTVTFLMISSWILPITIGATMVFSRHGEENFDGKNNKCVLRLLMESDLIAVCSVYFFFSCLLIIVMYFLIWLKIHQQVKVFYFTKM